MLKGCYIVRAFGTFIHKYIQINHLSFLIKELSGKIYLERIFCPFWKKTKEFNVTIKASKLFHF